MNVLQLLPIVALLFIFYFLLIRPQQKRAKEHQRLVKAIGPGDEIVTIGGLFGVVVEVTDDRVMIEAYDGSQLEFLRSAISRKVNLAPVAEPEDDTTSISDKEDSKSSPASLSAGKDDKELQSDKTPASSASEARESQKG